MRQAFIIIVFLLTQTILFSQDCPTLDVTLASQEDVDQFVSDYPDCTILNTNLNIIEDGNGSPIEDLENLENLLFVNGSITIEDCTILENLNGLLQINVAGLNTIRIVNNPLLGQCDIEAICNSSNPDNIFIQNNDAGCRNVGEIQSTCLNPDCPDRIEGYVLLGEFEGHTYYVSDVRRSWTQAQQEASNLANGNAYLASVQSEEENQFIHSRLGQVDWEPDGANEEVVFFGLSDTENEGELIWDDGNALSYSNFSNQNANTVENDFGQMNLATGEWVLENNLFFANYIVELNCGALMPDLTLGNLVPSVSIMGSREKVPYSLDVRNIGTETAAVDSIIIRTYLSLDTILDPAVDSLAGIITTGNNNPQENTRTEANITVPIEISGQFYFISFIDYNNKVEERYEDNNIVVSREPVQVIDLTNKCLDGTTILWTQEQVDTLLNQFPDCTVLNGSLILQDEDLNGDASQDPITSLLPLQRISWIEGALTLDNLAGLENLNGFEQLQKVSNIITINNSGISNLDELSFLDTLGGIIIEENSALTNLNGLNGLEFIYGSHIINNNPVLTELYNLDISLLAITGTFEVTNNTSLNSCNTDFICANLLPALNYTFLDNGPDCESNQDVEDRCGLLYPITFEIYIDLNANGTRESNEPNYSNGFLEVIETNVRYYMGRNDEIRTIGLPRGDYNLFFDQIQFSDWELTTQQVSFNISASAGNEAPLISIGLSALSTGAINNVNMATFIASPKARCLETIELEVCAKNTGTAPQNGKFYVELDPRVAIVSFTDTPDEVTSEGLYGYDYAQVYPGQTTCKRIKIKIPSPEDYPPGTLLNFNSFILDNDNEPVATYDYLTELKCSYDPNDKAIVPQRESNVNLIDEYLNYTIRFQNTGNDTAYQVIIRDTLDEQLDLSQFNYLGSNFEPKIDIQDGRYLSFQFDNIYLPDSTTDFAGSQGYVSYLIRAKEDINEGSVIQNTAHIYFDFNPPVITNTIVSLMLEELPACEITSIFINQQSQVDEFKELYRDCERVRGNIFIEGSNISNLNGLSNLKFIDGDLIIQNTMINTLDGLNDVSRITGDFELNNNILLQDFTGIEELTLVGSDLLLTELNSLKDFKGMESLLEIGGRLVVEKNSSLRNFSGLDNVFKIGDDFLCSENSSLNTFNGLNDLLTIGGNFQIYENHALDGLNGLNDFNSINGNLEIKNNSSLQSMIGLGGLENVGGDFEIVNNTSLNTLIGLNNLVSVSENFRIQANPLLSNLAGLESLVNIIGHLELRSNANLKTCKGLEGLKLIQGNFNLDSNPELNSLEGLGNLTKIAGQFNVLNNHELKNLEGLESLNIIEGGLQLFTCGLVTLTGLESLENLGSLIVSPAENLVNFSGLEQLTSIPNDFTIRGNKSLNSTNGLSSLRFIGGDMIIEFTDINSLAGLDNLQRVQGSLNFSNNNNLDNIASLASLRVLGKDLLIESTKLVDLDGLRNVDNIDGYVTIRENDSLRICSVIGVCKYLDDGNDATIEENFDGCNNTLEVEEMCSLAVDNDNDGFTAADDCDDQNPNIYPGAMEVPNNGIDEDCDGEDLIDTAIHQLGDQRINIYPNPVGKILYVESTGRASLQYECIDLAGKIWQSGKLNTQKEILSMSDLDSGMYLLKIYDTAKGQYIVDRFIKL